MTVGELASRLSDPVILFALAYAAATAVVVLFVLALALGKPWGEYAMGGRWPGRLPPAVRVLEVVQALVLAALAAIVLDRAGLIEADWLPDVPWLAWVPVAVSALSLLANASSRSAPERRTWVPVAIVMVVSSLAVVLLTA
ncbi:MAG TPA: hypothetical protein VFY23_06225 [Candidatus Limnocylindrales bacterium]|nr:hypothetical protein [Candidatus Limnocylindrales bacterium]